MAGKDLRTIAKDPSATPTMCNPPFYSYEDIAHPAEAKDFDPQGVNKFFSQTLPLSLTIPSIPGMHWVGGGNDNSGEVDFVLNMMEESLLMRQRCT